MVFTINSINYTKVTDDNGVAKLLINLNPGIYTISATFKDLTNVNKLIVRDSNTIFIGEGTTNNEIQNIVNAAPQGSTLEFTGNHYDGIHLTVSKQLNLVSFVGTTLNGINNNPIILISGNGASGTRISGLNLVGGLAGIRVTNIANKVELSNNTISNSRDGIVLDTLWDCHIENNVISKVASNGISLKGVSNVTIINNILDTNTNGIYFDAGNQNINIINNTITKSSEYAINLQKSGEYSLIEGNSIKNNQNGIFLNCKADGLVIRYNNIENNDGNGINIGSDYKKTVYNEDATIEDNVVVGNGDMNILARESSYDYHNFGSNWVGSDKSAFSGVCAKIKMTPYGLSIKQTGSGTLELSIGKDGNTASRLPLTSVSVSFDGGKTFQVVQIKNGNAVVHVSNADGNVIVRDAGPMVSVNLKDYVPYGKPETPTNPTNPDTPENPSNSSSTENGGGIATNVGNNGNIVDSIAFSIAEASASISAATTANQQEAGSSSETSKDSADSSQDSQSVSKSITIDDEIVKIAGMGIIILFIILVVAVYYRKDIQNMLNSKKRI